MIFGDLVNFSRKCIGGQLKLSVFVFVWLVMQKVQKVESINMQSDCKTTRKNRADPLCVFKEKKYEKVESVNKQNDYNTMCKKWDDKKKTNLFCKSV